MSDYRNAVDDFDKNVLIPKTAANVGIEPLNDAGYDVGHTEIDMGSSSTEDVMYLNSKKIIVRTYRLKK